MLSWKARQAEETEKAIFGENEKLCLLYRQGDQNALEMLWIRNSGMVEKIIQKYKGVEDPEDLKQEAFFGIKQAADLWDPDKGASFIHYAVFWIKQTMIRYIENCGSVVRVPVHQRQRIRKYHKTVNSYRVMFGRDPSDPELCCALDINHEQLEALKADVVALRIRSTSEIIGGENDDLTLEDTIASEVDQIEELIDHIQQEELSIAVWSEVDKLPEQQRDVIRSRYKEGQTLKECGDVMGVSSEYIRNIQEKALRELRKPKHTKVLRAYLTESGAYSFGIKSGLTRFRQTWESPQERIVLLLEEMEQLGRTRNYQ